MCNSTLAANERLDISDRKIKEIALQNGFKLKEQPDGKVDLNPYVYQFARALLTHSANK